MFKLLLCASMLLLTSCFNQVKAPDKITTEACFKDDKTGKCTAEVVVKHVITIEVPVALINDCVDQYKDLPEPDKTLQTQECINQYTEDLVNLIKGLTPPDVTTP
jgi:hypothetical protein